MPSTVFWTITVPTLPFKLYICGFYIATNQDCLLHLEFSCQKNILCINGSDLGRHPKEAVQVNNTMIYMQVQNINLEIVSKY